MIKLKLSLGDKEKATEFEISDKEWLSEAINRSTKEIPLGGFKIDQVFNVVLNGNIIESPFWSKISLKKEDNVLITPKIKNGEFGQIFKQFLIIATTVVASVYLGPAVGGGIYGALAVAAVTVATSLSLNALIPPPGVDPTGEIGGRGVEESQMYSISGQSNQMKRLGIVPKVYGTHRIFPNIAATPYTELSVDPNSGEIVQYLVAIYDFGLGTPQISDLKIGDTPLTSDSFSDFKYNFVDLARPDVPRDDFDLPLNKSFQLYKGERVFTQLSQTLSDGDENIQNTDNNPDSIQQEIILDFVCPRGLFGYNSGGDIGSREINLQIDFALSGSSEWKAYNDPTAVSSFEIIGGTDSTRFNSILIALLPDHPLYPSYYEGLAYSTGSFNSNYNYILNVYTKTGATSLLVPSSDPWEVGRAVFSGTEFLGYISSVNSVPGYPSYSDIALDRPYSYKSAFGWRGYLAYNGTSPSYDSTPFSSTVIHSINSVVSNANIVGSRTSAVYASFKFKPKEIGQFKVRVRRTGTSGDFSQQKEDSLTWGGLTTSYDKAPIAVDKRHVFMELRILATNQLNGNIQTLSGVASQVLEVYDPDTEVWGREITSNPAWVFVDLLTGEVNKKRVPISRLHLPSILEWAEYCAEVPTPPPSQSYSFPRFQCNFILDFETTLQGVIQQVCGASQASLNVIDGKYGILVDRLKTTPVQIFTPRNSKDFSSTRFYGPSPDGLKIKYIDPQLGWEVSEVVVYDNGKTEENSTELEEMTSFACTSQEQAWRFGRYMIAQNKLRQETMSLLVDFEYLVCTRGDYVQISQDVMEVGGRPARVKSVNGNEFTIDDSLDIDPNISYGVTHRSSGGIIETSGVSPISSDTFSLVSNKIVFQGADTTGQILDVYYRYGGVPGIIGVQRKIESLAGIFSGGDTTYTLPEAPLSIDEVTSFLDGVMRTDYTLVGNIIRFSGQDTTGQDFDITYRHSAANVLGSQRKITSLPGIFSGGDTTYTLPESPISDDDTIGWLNGVMRQEYTIVGNLVKFIGQDTTGQDFDFQYRYSGGSSVFGSGKRVLAVTGTYNGSDTTYTIPDYPLSNNDLVCYLDGIERSDYSQDIHAPEIGDLVVVGEIGNIVFDCIVKSITPNDDLSAQLTLVERANNIFSYESESVIPEYDPQISNTARPDFSPPKAVVGLSLVSNTQECSQTQSGYDYFAEITWDIPPGSVYEFFEIWSDDGRGYRPIANTNAKYFRVSIDQSRIGIEHGLKVVAVAASGRKLQLVAMPEIRFTPETKSTPPSNVENFGMSITSQTLQLTWTFISDCDSSKYEIRYSPDSNDVWEASTPLQIVDRNVNSIAVQARTGTYLIKAIDFAGNKSATASRVVTTIPNLFDLNIIEEFNDAPTFPGEFEKTEKLGDAVILSIQNVGSVDSMQFYPEGYYTTFDLLDLGDIYSVRLASYIRADGYRFGELISSWDHLSDIDHLNSTSGDDWDVLAEYRATDEILAMADWSHLSDIEHINEGLGQGFTPWRPIPTIGDATGRVFQFRVKLSSLTPNVTPRLFDATIKADMPDRTDSFENLSSSASLPTDVVYDKRFNGPAPSPNVQISIDSAQTGDYWEFEYKTLEGFRIRFYDKNGTQVVRQFDVLAKGFGSRHTVTI